MYGFLIIFFIGLGFLAYGVIVFANHKRAKSWPTVVGKLTALSHEVEYEEFETKDGYACKYLVPKPKYEYSVSELKYEGSQLCLDEKSGWYDEKEISKTANYFFCKVGEPITVSYNPKNPANSALQVKFSPKRRSHYLAICVSGILLIAISIALAIYTN